MANRATPSHFMPRASHGSAPRVHQTLHRQGAVARYLVAQEELLTAEEWVSLP